MKKILVASASFLMLSGAIAQTEKSVSNDAVFTICFNGSNIQQKMSVADFEKLDIIDELKKEIGPRDGKTTSLKKMGFDFSKNAYFSVDRNDTATAVIFAMPLKSNKYVINKLKEDEGNVLIKHPKYTIFRDYRDAIIITKNQLLYVDYDIDWRYRDEYTEVIEEGNGEREEPIYRNEEGKEISRWEWKAMKRFEATKNYALDRIEGKNASKKLKTDSKAPMYAWLNQNFMAKINQGRYSRRDDFWLKAQEELANKFGTSNMFMELNIDDNGGVFSIETKMSEQMKKMMDAVYNNSIDENLLKYIPQDAIGYSAYALNAKGLYKEYKNLFANFSSDNEEAQLIKDVWDLIDLALDEDAIFETIKGDAVLAFNGIQEVEFTKTKWEYDEETFEEKRVEVTAKDNFPVFTAAFSIGNKEMYEKVFRIIAKNERDFEKREDGSWVAKDRKLQTYFYLVDNALVITNGTDFNMSTAKNGFNKSMADKKELFANNPFSLAFDFNKLLDQIPVDDLRGEEKDMVEIGKTYKASVQMLPLEKNGNVWKMSVRLNTGGKGKNGMQHFMNFVNDFYKAEQKRREERRKKWEKMEKEVEPVEDAAPDENTY